MRRVNFRFLLGMIVCVLVIAGAVHALHTYQHGNHITALWQLVRDSQKSDNRSLRIEHLRRYVAVARDDAESVALLGRLLVESGSYGQAQLPLTTALNLYEAQGDAQKVVDIRRSLADVAIKTGRIADAEFQLGKLIIPIEADTSENVLQAVAAIDPAQQPKQSEYHEQLAICRMQQSRWDDAARELQTAVALDATRCDAYRMLADVHAEKLEQMPQAVAALDTMVEANPQAANAFRYRGSFRARMLLLAEQTPNAESVTSLLQAEGARRASAASADEPAESVPLTTAELRDLAAADATRALELAPDDRNVLMLAMQCARLYRSAPDRAVAAAQMAAAADYARRIIASCESEFVERRDKAEETLRARANNRRPRETKDEGADTPAAPAQLTLSSDDARSLRAIVYQAAVPAYNTLADVALFENNPVEAVRVLNEGLDILEFDDTLLLNLASLKISPTPDPELTALIARLDRNSETKPLAEFLKARQLEAAGSLELALNAFDEVLSKLGRWPEAALLTELRIADCQLQLDRPSDAVAAYERVLDDHPRSLPALLGLGRALEAVGDRNSSERSLQIYSQLYDRRQELSDDGQLADLAFRTVRIFTSLNAGRPANDPVWQNIQAQLNEYRTASQGNADAEIQIDLLEADVLALRKMYPETEQMLRDAVTRHPQSARLWAALAWIQDRIWLVETAAQSAAAPDTPPQPVASRAVETLDAADAAIVDPTPDDRVTLQVARARHVVVTQRTDAFPQLQQMAADALSAEEQARSSATAESQVVRSAQLRLIEDLGNMCALVGDIDTATQLFERLRQSSPNHVRSRLMLFDLALRTEPDGDQSPESLAAHLRTQQDRMSAVITEIGQIPGMEFLMNYCKAVQVVVEFDAAALNDAEETEESAKAKTDQLATALQALDAAAAKRSNWNRVAYMRGEVHDRMQRVLHSIDDMRWTKEFEVAADAYEDAFANGYRTPEFVAKLLLYLNRTGRYAAAADALSSLKTGQALSPVTMAQTAAGLSDLLGDADQWSLDELAVDKAEDAAQEGATDPAALLTYANILLWRDNFEKAETVLHQVRDLQSTDIGIWQQLVLGYRRVDVLRRARMPDAPPDALQKTLRDTLAAAQPLLSKPEFGVLAGSALSQLGERAEARARYAEELAAVPADLRQATATQLELLSQAAAFYLQESTTVDPEAHQTGEAILQRLSDEGAVVYHELRDARRQQGARAEISKEERQLAAVVPAARRHLASRLMSRTDAAGQEAALALLARNREFQYTDEDKRIEALILSRSADAARRDSGISLLENVIAGSLTPEATDRLLVATMHLTEYQADEQHRALRVRAYGDTDSEAVSLQASAERHLNAAREQTRTIVLAGPGAAGRTGQDGPFLAALTQQIEILLIGDDVADAEFYLDQLKRAAPDSAATAVIEARLRFAMQRHEEARSVLLALVDGAAPDKRLPVMASVAQLLENFGKRLQDGVAGQPQLDPAQPPVADYYQVAEQLLQQVAQRSADDRLLLAAFYGRRGRVDEAMATIAAELEAASAPELASACAQLMSGIGRDKGQMARLDELLVAAREKHPDSMPLKLLLADVRTWQGDGTAAEALYREVLAAAPTHVVAANNLAYLLASQKKNLDEALEWINVAIGKMGPQPDLLDTRAYVWLQREDPQQAIADLGSAVARRPSAPFLFHLAQAKLSVGLKQEAKTAWESAERAGLTEDLVHPAERESYRHVQSQL